MFYYSPRNRFLGLKKGEVFARDESYVLAEIFKYRAEQHQSLLDNQSRGSASVPSTPAAGVRAVTITKSATPGPADSRDNRAVTITKSATPGPADSRDDRRLQQWSLYSDKEKQQRKEQKQKEEQKAMVPSNG